MVDPVFWLGLSILFVAASLAAVLVTLIPVVKELARAARSAEKLFDTLSRELPPTLEAIRLTGMEISDLTEDLSDGVQSAGRVVKQVDQGLSGATQQVGRAGTTTRGVFVGFKTAWKTFREGPELPAHSEYEQLEVTVSPSDRPALPAGREAIADFELEEDNEYNS